MVTAIILASGKGERMGLASGADKCFLSLGARPVIAWSLLAFEKCQDVHQIILTVRKEQLTAARTACQMFGISKVRKIVAGGNLRQDSVMNALKNIDQDTSYVVIHDAARPCVTPEIISDTLKFARRTGTGISAHPVTDTIKVIGKGLMAIETPDRSTLWAVQTPQTFQTALIRKAYAEQLATKKVFTDDASIVEASGTPVRLVESKTPNPKITTTDDLAIAAAILRLV